MGTVVRDLLYNFVEKFGEKNVVKVITENATNMKLGQH